jgi:hypothetical protein
VDSGVAVGWFSPVSSGWSLMAEGMVGGGTAVGAAC